jgi:4-amino-4-deoxy-L-arabinose transferase-like glycosyltransferase
MSGEGEPKRRNGWWVFATVLLILLVVDSIRVRLLNLPLERDEGEYGYIGQLLLSGIPPFKLAYTMKLPGTPMVYALFMACFGQTAAGIHFGFLLMNAATIVMVFFLARRLLGVEGGLVACGTYAFMSLSPAVLGLCAHATHFVIIFVLGGLLTFLRAVETKRWRDFFLSGLFFGAAFIMKQPGLLFAFVPVLLIVWFEIQLVRVRWGAKRPDFNWRRCAGRTAAVCLGVVIPYSLILLWMWRAGVLQRFWFWTGSSAASYGHDVAGAVAWDRLANRYFGGDCGPDVLFWLLAAICLVLMCFDRKPGDRKAIILVLLVVSLLAVCPGLYFRQHYFVLALPALALLIGYGLVFARRVLGAAGVGAIGRSIPLAVFVGICAVTVLEQWQIYARDTPAAASRDLYGPTDPFPEMEQIGAYIRTNTASGDRIAVIGSDPEVSFSARRKCVTGYMYTFNLMEAFLPAVQMQKEMIQEIEAGKPAVFVDVRLQFSWNRTPDSEPTIFNWRDDYLPKNGDLIGVVNFSTNQPAEFHWGPDAVNYYDPQSECVCLWKRKAR